MTSSSGFACSLRDVSLRYGAKVALDDVTLAIPAGRIMGVIGPDGVGKSSLLALIAGARRIQAGEVEVLGLDLRDARRSTRDAGESQHAGDQRDDEEHQGVIQHF